MSQTDRCQANRWTNVVAVLLLALPATGQWARVESVGAGTAGSAGVPALEAGGFAVPGQVSPAIRITSGLPFAPAQLVVSNELAPMPLPGTGAWLFPGAPFSRLSTQLDATGTSPVWSDGPSTLDAAVDGLDFVLQGLVLDAGAAGGLATTGGLVVTAGAGSAVSPSFAHPHISREAPFFVRAADLNGDGLDDLIVGHVDQTTAIHFGLGNGHMATPITIPQPPQTFALLDAWVADVNGDGLLDLVLSTLDYFTSRPRVDVHAGHGDGTFAQPVSTLVAPTASSLTFLPDAAVADMDADGRDDLAVVAPGIDGVVLLRGTASGALEVEATIDTGITANRVFVDDVDGDGSADIVCVEFSPSPLEDSMASVVFGAGAPFTFGSPTVFGTGRPKAEFASLTDLDDDDLPELLVTHALLTTLPAPLLMLHRNIGGVLAAPTAVGGDMLSGRGLSALEATGDEHVDIVMLDAGKATGVSDAGGFILLEEPLFRVLPGRGDATFGEALSQPLPDAVARLTMAHLDDSPAPDAVLFSALLPPIVALGEGDGHLDLAPVQAGPWLPFSMLIDVDDDGFDDQLGTFGSSLQVALGQGDGTFGPVWSQQFVIGFASAFLVADLDDDGDRDAAMVDVTEDSLVLLAGNGDGTFAPWMKLPAAPVVINVFFTDVDGDGDGDLVSVSRVSRSYAVAFGDGTGAWDPAPVEFLLTTPGGIDDIALGDVTGDGLPDLVVARHDVTRVDIYAGTGTSVFADAIEMDWPIAPLFVEALDVDGDGTLDAVGGGNSALAALPSSDEAGDPRILLHDETFVRSVTLADATGDGAPDLLWSTGTALAVSPSIGAGEFGTVHAFAWGAGTWALALGDLDGDGRVDVVLNQGATLLGRNFENALTGSVPRALVVPKR